MPRTNQKKSVSPAALRKLAERIHSPARKLEELADRLESSDQETIGLALDTFVQVTLTRLEGFARTCENTFESGELAAEFDFLLDEPEPAAKKKKRKP